MLRFIRIDPTTKQALEPVEIPAPVEAAGGAAIEAYAAADAVGRLAQLAALTPVEPTAESIPAAADAVAVASPTPRGRRAASQE